MPPSLLEAFEEHLETIQTRDLDRFAATLASDDVRFVGGDGKIIEGRENIVAAHREWFSDDSWTFEPEILWTHEDEASGWTLTRVRYTQPGLQRAFLLLFLFVREGDAFKVAYDQNTPIA